MRPRSFLSPDFFLETNYFCKVTLFLTAKPFLEVKLFRGNQHLLNALTTVANLSITIGFLRKAVSWKPLEFALPAPNTPPCSILQTFWVALCFSSLWLQGWRSIRRKLRAGEGARPLIAISPETIFLASSKMYFSYSQNYISHILKSVSLKSSRCIFQILQDVFLRERVKGRGLSSQLALTNISHFLKTVFLISLKIFLRAGVRQCFLLQFALSPGCN